MNISKKWPVLGAFLVLLGIIFSGVGTKYLPEKDEISLIFNNEADLQQTETKSNIDLGVNLEGEVPYLKKLPILDKNLFIEQHYSQLIFGGVNFEFVKFAARTDEGVKAELLDISNSQLKLPVFDMPYLEFEYKDKFYTLEVFGEVIGPDNIKLTYTIKNIKSASMSLKSAAEYIGT
ncbi:hypothetical protein [Shewanella scandinavica]|uniref:hypothetical protein n=1 Tax=Shewanella scandinavica TaxID=3063538 RepID=UPI00318CA374